jgi:hypothetical protein
MWANRRATTRPGARNASASQSAASVLRDLVSAGIQGGNDATPEEARCAHDEHSHDRTYPTLPRKGLVRQRLRRAARAPMAEVGLRRRRGEPTVRGPCAPRRRGRTETAGQESRGDRVEGRQKGSQSRPGAIRAKRFPYLRASSFLAHSRALIALGMAERIMISPSDCSPSE